MLERAGEKSGSSFWTGFRLGGEKVIAQSRKLSCRPQVAHQTAGLASGDKEREAAPRAPLHPSAWWAAPGAPTHGRSIPGSGPLRRCSRFAVFCSSLSGSALRLSRPHFSPLPSLPPTPSHHTVLSSHMEAAVQSCQFYLCDVLAQVPLAQTVSTASWRPVLPPSSLNFICLHLRLLTFPKLGPDSGTPHSSMAPYCRENSTLYTLDSGHAGQRLTPPSPHLCSLCSSHLEGTPLGSRGMFRGLVSC